MFSACAFAAEPQAPSQEEATLADAYFRALENLYRAGSTRAEIDRVLSLMTDDIVYEHTRYGAQFDRTSWERAFERVQNAGAYNHPQTYCIKAVSRIPGIGAEAISYSYGELNADLLCIPPDEREHLIVFHYRDAKIRKIEELW